MAPMNDAFLKDVINSYQQLRVEWGKKNKNLDKCGQMLEKLKLGLTQLIFLPTSNDSASVQELIVARDILEMGVQWSAAKKDIPSFQRYMSQLKCYYLDFKNKLPESPFQYQLLGLNLLYLLSQNRVADFHTELELLSPEEIHDNVYIRHPISLEQYLMEGSYNKIFLAKGNVPATSYTFFIDILLDTIRDEIAACVEKAYERLSFADATKMLFFQSSTQMEEFSSKRGWKAQSDGNFHFTPEVKKTDEVIPSQELADVAIEYARELERIV